MADLNSLYNALKAADAAGNQSDAAAIAGAIKAASGNGQPVSAGPQPSTLQTLAASPLGRFAHDTLLPMVEGPARLLAKIDPTGGMVAPMADKAQQGYQAALAAQRNRLGYADARQQADAQAAARGAGGMTDQVIGSMAPAMAGTAGLFGGLNASNAAADAQTAAQNAYSAKNPTASSVAQIGGGFLGTPEGAMANLPAAIPKQVAPTIDALNSAKKAAYAVVDNSPMSIAKSAVKDLHDTINTKLARMGLTDQTIGNLAPKTATAMDALKSAAQGDQTLQGMDIQRRIAGIAAGAPDKTDRAAARIMQDHIDDFVGNLTPQQLSGPVDQAAINALPVARDLAQRSFKAQTIQGLMDKATTSATGFGQSGLENSIRAQFRKLANNDRGIARFNSDEQAAIRRVATGGSVLSANNLLRDVGKLAPYGALPMIMEGNAAVAAGMAGGVPGLMASAAIPATGAVARAGATAMTKAAAQRALDMTLLGKTRVPVSAVSPLRLPSLTPQSAVPYGLFGSSLATQNQ